MVQSFTNAQPTTQPSLEPGAAQSKETTTRAAITDFTHPPVETRGVWLASRDIFVPRDQLLAKLDQLKDAGFTRVMIDTQFRGGVLYPDSKILPQVPEAKGEDLLKLLVDECHKRGMKADAWMEYGFYAYFTPRIRTRRRWANVARRRPVDAEHRRERRGRRSSAIVRHVLFALIRPIRTPCANCLAETQRRGRGAIRRRRDQPRSHAVRRRSIT